MPKARDNHWTNPKFISRVAAAAALYLIYMCISICSVSAQDVIPADAAPPPLKLISKDERAKLASINDVKNRTKLSLELMELRVKVAEQYMPQEQFEMVFRELGGFHALVDDALSYLQASDTNKGRVLDNFKRFEMGLRKFTPRLELIRREMTPQREYYLRMLLRELREARTKAVEPLFGDTTPRKTL